MKKSQGYLIVALLWVILLHVTGGTKGDVWAWLYVGLALANMAAWIYYGWKERSW